MVISSNSDNQVPMRMFRVRATVNVHDVPCVSLASLNKTIADGYFIPSFISQLRGDRATFCNSCLFKVSCFNAHEFLLFIHRESYFSLPFFPFSKPNESFLSTTATLFNRHFAKISFCPTENISCYIFPLGKNLLVVVITLLRAMIQSTCFRDHTIILKIKFYIFDILFFRDST